MKLFRQLGADIAIYGLGLGITRGLIFAFMLAYTHIFDPTQYGVIELLVMIASFLGALMVMGQDSSLSYFFYEQNRGAGTKVSEPVTAIFQWRIVSGIGVSSAAVAIYFVWQSYFEKFAFTNYILVVFGTLALTLSNQAQEVFRLARRPVAFTLFAISNAALAGLITLVCYFWLGLGTTSYFIGYAGAALTTCISGWSVNRSYLELSKVHTDWWPRILKLGLPLLPAALLVYIMNMADRWFIEHYEGIATLGVFAVGARFAAIAGLGAEIFRRAWWPHAMNMINREEGPGAFRDIAPVYLGIALAGVLAVDLFSPWLVHLTVSSDYYSSTKVIGVLAWQAVFNGFYLIACGGIWRSKRTSLTPILLTASVALNIFLNWILTPRYGMVGAAYATVVSYFFWSLITLIISEKLWPIGLPKTLLAAQLIAAGLCHLLINYSGASLILIVIVCGAVMFILNLPILKYVHRQSP